MLGGVLTRSRGDFEQIFAEADLIVEVMGGIEPAREYLLRAMQAGRHVVTANKQLLSHHGEELFAAASEHGVQLRFEAAVAGVVPVVRVLEESLSATPIERIHGIVNGTTNFILTRMAHGSTYEEALAEAQRVGYAEADPSDDVSGRDAAAKMAILARLAFGSPVHLDDVPYEGIEHLHSDDLEYARELGLGLKLIGTAERRDGGLSVRVHPAFLYAGHPLASVSGPFNAVTVESETITEITLSGPGAGGLQTASAVLGDVVSVMTGGARPPAPPLPLELIADVESAFYLHLDVADEPGVLAAVTRVLGEHAVSIKSVVQRGLGDHAQLVMVTHPVLESAPARGGRAARRVRLHTLFPADDPRDRRGVHVSLEYEEPVPLPPHPKGRPTGTHVPLIERYRERLPFEPGDPLVSLQEGSTPLLRAPVLSEMLGANVRLKLEGANPTGSFKDRGMTCAVSAAVRDGAKAVICASTGNTAASAAAYAARARIRCAVIVPEGNIATGKMAQTLIHGARVISLAGNFDQALKLVRELADTHPIVLVNSVNEFRIEGQKTAAFELHEALEGTLDALCIPVGNAGNITSYWRGFTEMGAAPRLLGLQAQGAAPIVEGRIIEHPETVASAIRIGNPVRWEDAMAAATDSRGAIRAVSDAEILDAYRLLASKEGMFCEPASAASVAGLLKYGADGARQIVCVLTGRGIKDPETAIAHNDGRIISCPVELAAIEEAVLGDP